MPACMHAWGARAVLISTVKDPVTRLPYKQASRASTTISSSKADAACVVHQLFITHAKGHGTSLHTPRRGASG